MVFNIYEIDCSTPHPGVTVINGVATRETNCSWVTMRSTEPLTAENHQWGIRVIDQGESNDDSGLMLGLLPELSPTLTNAMGCKYISELGGWCLSRAGDTYGSWKCEKFPFGTGSVVEFDWDATSGALYMVCGKKRVTGHVLSLNNTDVVYPAFSLYYPKQKLVFV